MANVLRYLIPTGFLKRTREDVPGYFNFDRVIAEILNRLGVAFNDKCCPGLSKRIPTSMNPVTGQVEYLDSADNTWKSVASYTPPTSTTTTTSAAPTTTSSSTTTTSSSTTTTTTAG